MTTIYHYFCKKKKNIFQFFSSKKFMKICSITHQIEPFKKITREACTRTLLANAWLRHASQAASRHATRPAFKKLDTRPWQIIHTPMEIYLRRCARRIHAGIQFIVCSTLYVYALQNFCRRQK